MLRGVPEFSSLLPELPLYSPTHLHDKALNLPLHLTTSQDYYIYAAAA
jgi:hypothetical protein